jgi:hypothetical protein
MARVYSSRAASASCRGKYNPSCLASSAVHSRAYKRSFRPQEKAPLQSSPHCIPGQGAYCPDLSIAWPPQAAPQRAASAPAPAQRPTPLYCGKTAALLPMPAVRAAGAQLVPLAGLRLVSARQTWVLLRAATAPSCAAARTGACSAWPSLQARVLNQHAVISPLSVELQCSLSLSYL